MAPTWKPWQGEPHRLQLFVIRQGTVSLWDETGEEGRLRDVRGAGDMLGVERYNDAPNRHEVFVGGPVRDRRGPRDGGLSADQRTACATADLPA